MLLCLVPSAAYSQAVDSTLWTLSPGDRVLAIAPVGDTVYVGGSFISVGPATGGGVPVDAHSGLPLPRFAQVVGEVDAVVADGSGGWFIGGLFPYVAGLPRTNLAHLAADGSVLPWAPNPNNQVWALVRSDDTLFVGGDFDSIGGVPRARIAALTPGSSVPTRWQCDSDGRVSALLVGGQTLYAGGWFSALGGQPRAYVGAADKSSGAVLDWQVNLDDRVRALVIADTTLFLGGYFTSINGDSRLALGAVGAQTGALHSWDPQLMRFPISSLDGGAHVSALLVDDDSLFVAGSFSSLGGQPRPGLAQLGLASAQATPWLVNAHHFRSLGPEFWALERSGDSLFIAGEFDTLAGAPGSNTAVVSVMTADRMGWNPRTNDYVFALSSQDGAVYLGGRYTSIGEWVPRHGLAAIDVRAGRVTDWDPNPDDLVKSLLAWNGKIYVGGQFSQVGGQPRDFLAAVDQISGQATGWHPTVNSPVWTLQPMGQSILAGGLFTSLLGTTPGSLAALDTSTAQLTNWKPNVDGDVYALAVTDTAVYIGGDFTTCAGQPRASLAAVDPRTAAPLPWNPGVDGLVSSLALHNGSIYVGGYFHQLGGAPREFLGSVDGSGAATPWIADTFGPSGPRVEALAASDSFIFAGGFFSGVSGTSSEYFAAIDPVSGAVNRAFPTPNGAVWSLATQGNAVYVGGGFGQVGRALQEGFAVIRFSGPSTPPKNREFELLGPMPNPVKTSALLRYTLPARAAVSLTVYDLQGRAVARVLRGEPQSAGTHSASLSASAWRSGCYLVRFQAGSLHATRKLVVVR